MCLLNGVCDVSTFDQDDVSCVRNTGSCFMCEKSRVVFHV